MKIVQIVHNPTAGDAEHSRKTLLDLLKDPEHVLNYLSTDWQDWESMYSENTDLICVAGGDGTVHKLGTLLLRNEKTKSKSPLIRLLPLGTANNIAATLQISGGAEKIGARAEDTVKDFDCGRITGLEEKQFFLESVGFGLFPELIWQTEKEPVQAENASEELNRILEVLLEVVRNFEAQEAEIEFDGMTIKGKFLMVELMNIKFIGPRFKIAPGADPGDGYFDLVLIPEKKRSALEEYLEKKVKGISETYQLPNFAKTIRVQKIRMKWSGKNFHVDDTALTEYAGKEITVDVIPGALKFMVSETKDS